MLRLISKTLTEKPKIVGGGGGFFFCSGKKGECGFITTEGGKEKGIRESGGACG